MKTLTVPSWTTFRALGTYVHLTTTGDVEWSRRLAEEVLAEVDAACSRFRRDSDLSRANAAAGSWTEVSPLFVAALQVALDVASQTDGLVDPTLGRNLVEIGYAVDFGELRRLNSTDLRFEPTPASGGWAAVQIREDAVRVPRGTALDLGSSAKAWASDLVAQSLFEETGDEVLVSLGGDISIAGPAQSRRRWAIDISEHPPGTAEDVGPARVLLRSGGLATSSTVVRRWRSGGVERHHLIDPRTGSPTDGPWRTVTATGPTCVAANAASTAALVLGEHAVGWLQERSVSARLVATDGSIRTVGQWPATSTWRR